MKLEVIRDHLIEALTLRIQREFTIMCSLKTCSLFQDKSKDALYNFFKDFTYHGNLSSCPYFIQHVETIC